MDHLPAPVAPPGADVYEARWWYATYFTAALWAVALFLTPAPYLSAVGRFLNDRLSVWEDLVAPKNKKKR